MPVFKNRVAFEVARGIKVFLNLELGATSGEVPGAFAPEVSGTKRVEGIKPAERQLIGKDQKVPETRTTPAAGKDEVQPNGFKPENMVWIFGTGRSGSTWLRSMMSEMKNHKVWEEPMVGKLFGGFYGKVQEGQLNSTNFIMSDPTRKGWVKSIRNFTIDGARYAHPNLKPEDYLIIKEPNGTEGAPLLMEALPESRMIFLVRDPRDVVASSLDAAKKDSWLYQRKSQGKWKDNAVADTQPEVFVKQRADRYLLYIGKAKQAYDLHKGPKGLVKYEDLVSDTLGTMKRLYSDLYIPFDEKELSQVVEKHSWENIPQEKKGEGKFYRKGTAGGWKEDLTEEQVEIVERITAPLLRELYSGQES